MWTTYNLWNTSTLLGVIRETDEVPSYFLDLLFPNVMTSEGEYIDLETIPNIGRKLAPFVVPLAQGRPIYEEGSRVSRFKPAYVKALDPVTPTRVMTKRPGSLLGPSTNNPMQKYNAIKADILVFHRAAVERRWEWLAAKAILDGAVTLEGDDYPSTLVDFGRAAGHTVTLTGDNTWDGVDSDPLANIQAWMDTMHNAPFGGAPNRLTVGTGAWPYLRDDPKIKDLMDTRFRGGGDLEIRRGLLRPGEVRFVGSLGAELDVYVYNDWYTVDGTVTRFMSANDVLLTGPNVMGYRCYGAIQDVHAQFQALEMFPRNFIPQGDPAVEQILTQSAPIMVPVNPNATFKATVL